MASAATSAVRSRSMPVIGSKMKAQQLDTLQHIVTKHIEDPSLADIAAKNDFAVTTNERGIAKWEHGHLVAALDTLNTYQRERRAKSRINMVGHRMGMKSTYKQDPRTRCVELLKRWLRNNAAVTNLQEDEVRRMSGLCRDIMNHPTLFPARNERSFMKSIAEVYQHLDVQLREVLERDRTCAELAQHVLSLSRNLVSDAIGYLLVGPTDLKKTDELPSLEIVSLWASLPTESHPLPKRIDQKMQRTMHDVWHTHCGKMIAHLLQTRWCVSLFEGAGAQEEAASTPRHAAIEDVDMSALIEEIKEAFERTSLSNSGLAGSFRRPEKKGVRMEYISAIQVLVDLIYLIGEALVQFHRISDGLGDYGMIRVATWLHPFLEALTEKVNRLKCHLENLKKAVDENLIVAKAKGYKVEKPTPSQQMTQRASLAIDRSVVHGHCHVTDLLQAIEDLRRRSSPDRLPQVVASIGDACMQLDKVLSSPEFKARVGDRFRDLPRIRDGISDVALGRPQSMIEDCFSSRALTQGESACESGRVQTLRNVAASPRSTDLDIHFLQVGAPGMLAPRSPRVHHDASPMTCADTISQASREVSFGASTCSATHRGIDAHATCRPAMDVSNPFEDEAQDTTTVEALNPFDGDLQCPVAGSESPYISENIWKDARPRLPPAASGVSVAPEKIQLSPTASNVGDTGLLLHANVFRLSSAYCGPGFRRHDRRSLRLEKGHLDIFQKASTLNVKSSIVVAEDVEECSLFGSQIMFLVIRRLPPGVNAESGVWRPKQYYFEFGAAAEAHAFYNEIRCLLQH